MLFLDAETHPFHSSQTPSIFFQFITAAAHAPQPTHESPAPSRGAGNGQIACHQLHRFVASIQKAVHQWVIMVYLDTIHHEN